MILVRNSTRYINEVIYNLFVLNDLDFSLKIGYTETCPELIIKLFRSSL